MQYPRLENCEDCEVGGDAKECISAPTPCHVPACDASGVCQVRNSALVLRLSDTPQQLCVAAAALG